MPSQGICLRTQKGDVKSRQVWKLDHCLLSQNAGMYETHVHVYFNISSSLVDVFFVVFKILSM
jgi:hypothetical protein